MKLVSEQTATFKPEVSLAVNMAPTTDEDLEDFFFEHGFEYVSGQTQSGEQSPGLADSSSKQNGPPSSSSPHLLSSPIAHIK